jgi:regulator of protease activity HflC (stomatin/prohibitin superfamily)
MSRHDLCIIKETHRGLLYEDGVLKQILTAGRHQIPAVGTRLGRRPGRGTPKFELIVVDIRGRDRTFLLDNLLTADGSTISIRFALQFRVIDARLATHEVADFEERVLADARAAARSVARGMTFAEILSCRDEIAEEAFRVIRGTTEAYGVEVSGLELEELEIPADLRDTLERAAEERRIQIAQALEDRLFEDSPSDYDLDAMEDPDRNSESHELVLASATVSSGGEWLPARAPSRERMPIIRHERSLDGFLQRYRM